MKATISVDMTLGDIAAQYPQTRFVMEQLALDYCCGGKKTLRESATQAGRDPDDVLAALTRAIENRPAQDQIDFTTLPPAQLVDYIESSHHLWLRQHLPRISALMEKVSRAHAPRPRRNAPSLAEGSRNTQGATSRSISKRRADPLPLHPPARRLPPQPRRDAPMALRNGPEPHPPDGIRARRSRAPPSRKCGHPPTATASPQNACESFQGTYDELHAFELDLHQHIPRKHIPLPRRPIALEDEKSAHRQTT